MKHFLKNISLLIFLLAISIYGVQAATIVPERITPVGVELVIGSAVNFDRAQNSVVVGNELTGYKLYFIAKQTTTGDELWVSDGTVAGTKMLKDICPGSYGSGIKYLAQFNDKVVFRARSTDETGYELWISDGTEAGTVMVKDVNATGSSNPSGFTQINATQVVFAAKDCESTTTGETGQWWLWVSDGTEAGTKMIAACNIQLQQNISGSKEPDFVRVGNKAYFKAMDKDETKGVELWVTDGTVAGTAMVKDINTTLDPVTSHTASSNPQGLINCNNQKLFFDANESGIIGVPWKSDVASTLPLLSVQPDGIGCGVTNPFYFNNKVYYSAYNGSASGNELFTCDVQTNKTAFLKEINSGVGNCGFAGLAIFDNMLYFKGINGANGEKLYFTYGTAAKTILHPQSVAIDLIDDSEATVASGSLYFTATKGLYCLDSNSSTPFLAYPITDNLQITALTEMKGDLYFAYQSALYKYSYRKTPSGLTVPMQTDLIKIYPNPVKSTLNIDAKDAIKATIFAINGIKMQTIIYPQSSINVQDYPNGAYLLKIETSNGSITKKFMKIQ